MIDIVNRLRFDATRCELQFSKGVAGNISEAADTIERLTVALKIAREQVDGNVHGRTATLMAIDGAIRGGDAYAADEQ